MTEQELREKIAHIIAKKLCPNKNRHFALWGDEAHCYSRENFAECEVIADTVDALMSAEIGDVSEYKHRAEVEERALKKLASFFAHNAKFLKDEREKERYQKTIFDDWINQAEEELAEEGKDG